MLSRRNLIKIILATGVLSSVLVLTNKFDFTNTLAMDDGQASNNNNNNDRDEEGNLIESTIIAQTQGQNQNSVTNSLVNDMNAYGDFYDSIDDFVYTYDGSETRINTITEVCDIDEYFERAFENKNGEKIPITKEQLEDLVQKLLKLDDDINKKASPFFNYLLESITEPKKLTEDYLRIIESRKLNILKENSDDDLWWVEEQNKERKLSRRFLLDKLKSIIENMFANIKDDDISFNFSNNCLTLKSRSFKKIIEKPDEKQRSYFLKLYKLYLFTISVWEKKVLEESLKFFSSDENSGDHPYVLFQMCFAIIEYFGDLNEFYKKTNLKIQNKLPHNINYPEDQEYRKWLTDFRSNLKKFCTYLRDKKIFFENYDNDPLKEFKEVKNCFLKYMGPKRLELQLKCCACLEKCFNKIDDNRFDEIMKENDHGFKVVNFDEISFVFDKLKKDLEKQNLNSAVSFLEDDFFKNSLDFLKSNVDKVDGKFLFDNQKTVVKIINNLKGTLDKIRELIGLRHNNENNKENSVQNISDLCSSLSKLDNDKFLKIIKRIMLIFEYFFRLSITNATGIQDYMWGFDQDPIQSLSACMKDFLQWLEKNKFDKKKYFGIIQEGEFKKIFPNFEYKEFSKIMEPILKSMNDRIYGWFDFIK